MMQIIGFYRENYKTPFMVTLPVYYRVLGAKIQLTADGAPLYVDIEASDALGGTNEQRICLFAVLTTSDLIPPGAVFVCKIETPYDWKDSRYLYEIPDELPF
jgi:hypothetical protein